MVKAKKHKFKNIINTAVIFFLVFVAIYMCIQLFWRGGVDITTVRTQNITDDSYITLNGYVIRDEEVIYAPDGCLVDITVSHGDKLGVGKEYMSVYKTSLGGTSLMEAQNELDRYSDKIDILKSSLNENYTVSDISSLSSNISRKYSSLLHSLSKGDYDKAYTDGDDMLGYINGMDIASGKYTMKSDSLSRIEKEKQEYINSLTVGSESKVSASESMYIYKSFDGYENIIAYDSVKEMTPDIFKENVGTAKKTDVTNAVGRRVFDTKWYFMLNVSSSQLKYFEEGNSYSLIFEDGGSSSLKMTLDKITLSADKKEGLLVLSSRDIAVGADLSRYTAAKLKVGSVSGYKIPDGVITELDHDGDGIYDYMGVYVLNGNRVEFRIIEEIASGSGYIIAKTSSRYELDKEAKYNKPSNVESETFTDEEGNTITETETVTEKRTERETEKDDVYPYLSENELMIISGGGNLYDGKALK